MGASCAAMRVLVAGSAAGRSMRLAGRATKKTRSQPLVGKPREQSLQQSMDG